MSWLEKKWVGIVGQSIPRFKWTTKDVANGRCIICGDSKKSKTKARLYFYPVDGRYLVRCHNCGASMSLSNFIKDQFPSRHAEYLKDYLIENPHRGPLQYVEGMSSMRTTKEVEIPAKPSKNPIFDGVLLSELHDSHTAVIYARARKIPEESFEKIYYSSNFEGWVKKNRPKGGKKYDHLPRDSRIIFPIVDFDGSLIGVQGRALDSESNLRYITIKFFDRISRVYGRETLNIETPVLVVEGPIDSLFLPNCIALCGGDISHDLTFLDKKNTTIVLDNEPRNKDTVNRIEKAISSGFKVVVWKNLSSNMKDINDMVKNGMSQNEILTSIRENTFSGVRAKLELGKWKRV